MIHLGAEDVLDPRCEDYICAVTTPVSPEFCSSVYWIAVCLPCGWYSNMEVSFLLYVPGSEL